MPGSDVFLVAPCSHCLWRTLGKQAIPFPLWPLESSGVTPVAFVWPVAILSGLWAYTDHHIHSLYHPSLRWNPLTWQDSTCFMVLEHAKDLLCFP